MRMEILENGCLKILLTAEDLDSLGISFADLDYGKPATRKAVQALLEAARKEMGFDPAGGMLVEALPVDGGCLLLFTPTGGHRRARMKAMGGPYIYEVADADQLLRLAEGLRRFDYVPGRRFAGISGSSLYSFGGGYRLVLYPSAPFPRGMSNLLQEFARAAGEGDAAAAFTAEHGRPIAVGNALSRISDAMWGVSRPGFPGSAGQKPEHPPL